MSDWIGGLPPAAHERIERQRASGTAGSLLSAPAAASVRAAGLAPVGEVFGCLVMNLGWAGTGCSFYGRSMGGGQFGGGWGASGAFGYTTPITTSGDRSGGQTGFGPYVKSYEYAWNGALTRMLTEAAALGASGVVGVQITRTQLEGRAYEFAAVGTAVRTVDPSLIGSPSGQTGVWAANLSAEDCAAAILSGLVPRGIAIGLSVATKHEDWQIKQERSSWDNTEVAGLTGLLHAAREDSRAQIAAHAGRFGTGGDLVVTQMGLSEFDTACGEEQDLHAESLIVGTVLGPSPAAPFRTGKRASAPPIMTIIPLTDATSRASARRL